MVETEKFKIMEKVLIIGANGLTGTHVAKQLTDHPDFEPLAMIRKEEQKEKFDKMNVNTVIGDLEGDIDNAVGKADHIIFAAGSGSSTGTDKTYAVDRDGAIKTIEKAMEKGVKKYVMLSSMGAHDPAIVSEGSFKHYLIAKHDADEYLKKSDLDYTIVRPVRLTNDSATEKIKAAPHLNKSGKVSRADVARVLVESLTNPNVSRQTFEMLEGDAGIKEELKELV